MMKKLFLFMLVSLAFYGCDSIYQYVFLPPERIEYTLVPDNELLKELQDTSYYVSKDGKAVGYDSKDWKIEIRYMSDYQLNTFEFPEDSKAAEYSGNPYTYGDYIDPELGYTPRRFTIFKVTIYNYTGSKLNYDPELSILQTDRGDYFHAYGREKKNAKFGSIEEYYQKRKGTSGVDDDIFETRMGIARRTMLYYGKPVYKGDSREGLVVFDPIVNSVEHLKISVNDFVLGYDENNEPSSYTDLTFYFKQIPIEKTDKEKSDIFVENSDTTSGEGIIKIAQVKYKNDLTAFATQELNNSPQIRNNPWDPSTGSLRNLVSYIIANTDYNVDFKQLESTNPELGKNQLLIITGVDAMPDINYSAEISEAIKEGAFVFFDVAQILGSSRRIDRDEILKDMAKALTGKTEIKNVNLDHPIFSSWKKISELPAGYEADNQNIDPLNQLHGLYLNGKLVAVVAKKSYAMMWNNDSYKDQLNFGVNLATYAFNN